MPERVVGQLGDLTRHLDAGWTRAHDHKGEPARSASRVGLGFGRLECAEDPAARDERALERLHLGRVLAPLVVAEIRVA